MTNKPNILAICGSTKSSSTNRNLILAIADLFEDVFRVELFEDISLLPHFNPDIDNDSPPFPVLQFRQKLRGADAVLICTPEYAMGVPGTLKNAIDWTVSSSDFSRKPTALITASSLGLKSHACLLETLKVIEADIIDNTQLVISHAKTKINDQNQIIDSETLILVNDVINALLETISNSKKNFLFQ